MPMVSLAIAYRGKGWNVRWRHCFPRPELVKGFGRLPASLSIVNLISGANTPVGDCLSGLLEARCGAVNIRLPASSQCITSHWCQCPAPAGVECSTRSDSASRPTVHQLRRFLPLDHTIEAATASAWVIPFSPLPVAIPTKWRRSSTCLVLFRLR